MQPQPAGAGLFQFVPLLLIFVIFYFLLIKPQKQKEKEHKAMVSSLAKNDEVVTTGGIHGTIVNVKEKTVVLRIDDNAKMEIEKNCVTYVLKHQTFEKQGS